MSTEQKQKQSSLQVIEDQFNKQPSLRHAMQLPFVEKRCIDNYMAVTGQSKEVAKLKFENELFTMNDMAMENPKIAQANRMSAFIALIKVMSTGLSLKSEGHLYLQPSSNNNLKCVIGAHGKREMISKMKDVKFMYESNLVAVGDEFEMDLLNNMVTKHVKTTKSVDIKKIEDVRYAYCRIEYKDGRKIDTIVSYTDLVKAKSKSKNTGEASVWNEWPGQMCKKVPIHRAFKLYYHYPENTVIVPGMETEEEEETFETKHTVAATDFMPADTQQEEKQQVEHQEAEIVPNEKKKDFMED